MEGALKQEDQLKYETLIEAQAEISLLRKTLSEKDSSFRHLISTHETLKTTSKAEISKLESEKRGLISALDEANLTREEKETKIAADKDEIQRLRSLLEESRKKCKETEESGRTGKEVTKREEHFSHLEEEREKIQEKLKWKCEQFSHLEEAHKKLQSQLKEFKKETEKEKSEFIHKINEFETGLDNKTRLSEDLRTRLDFCNEALAREESKRKLLEVELRGTKDRYNSVCTDFEAARLELERVTSKRDEDVASLRGILADKSLQIKEIEFEMKQIEEENKELREKLKEYREIEIGGVEKSKKFKALEKKLRVRDLEIENLKKDLKQFSCSNCDEKIRVKEVEIENLKKDLCGRDGLVEEIRVKDLEIENLKKDLDEKDGLVEKIRVKDLEIESLTLKNEIENLMKDLGKKDGVFEEIKVKDLEIESLKNNLGEKNGLVEEIRVRDLEIESLKNEIKNLMKDLGKKDGVFEEINVKDLEIESLKKNLGEKNGLVEEIWVKDLEIESLKKEVENLKKDLGEKDGLVEEIKVRDVQIENLEKDLGDCLARLSENGLLDEKIRVKEVEIDNLKRDLSDCLTRLSENDISVEKIRVQEIEIENLKIKLTENDKLVEKIRIQEVELDNLKRDFDNYLDRLSVKDKLVEELKIELESSYSKLEEEKLLRGEESAVALLVIKSMLEGYIEKYSNKEVLVIEEIKQSEGLLFEGRERDEEMEELKLCLEREKAEKEKLIRVVRREREVVIGEIEEYKNREDFLVRENEKLISLVREREAEIEEIKEDNSRLNSLIRSLEEDRNEMMKKLLEIKFKLDPLEGKYKEFSKDKNDEILELEENIDSLVEALENTDSDLNETVLSYFLQEFEIQFKNGVLSEIESELEQEKFENENRKIEFLNEIEFLKREKENLELQILDLNCGIGSVFCADGEIRVILERISQKMKFEEELPNKTYSSAFKNKTVIPVCGIRSPFKENNF